MIARRAVARLAPNAQRCMSTATPKTHKAKDVWAQIDATRPKDPHPHNMFHPPYNTATVGIMITSIVISGYGVVYFGMRHQQYKQGYWK